MAAKGVEAAFVKGGVNGLALGDLHFGEQLVEVEALLALVLRVVEDTEVFCCLEQLRAERRVAAAACFDAQLSRRVAAAARFE